MTRVEVLPSDVLYRRVTSAQVSDGKVLSWTFDVRPGEEYLSAQLARLIEPAQCLELAGRVDLGVVSISVSAILEVGLVVEYDPTPQDASHVKISGRTTQSTRRRLARSSTIVIPPPGR